MFWWIIGLIVSLYIFPSKIWWIIVFIIFLLMIIKKFILDKLIVDDIRSKHVFVTGCDTGFGHLLALKLVENGIPTFAGCLTEEGKIELEKKSKWAPGKISLVTLDVTNDKSLLKAKEFVEDQLKNRGLWALVCNAGVAQPTAPDDWLNIEDYKKVMDINTFGVIRSCHAFKSLIKKEKGRIVIMSSMLGRIAVPWSGPYVASKFAVEGYADVLRLEGKQFGYTVHIIEPGFFKTGINPDSVIKVFENVWNRLDKKTKEEYGENFWDKTKGQYVKNLNLVTNDNPSHVVDVYYNAITSRFPSLRYHVGLDANLLFIPLSIWLTIPQDIASGLIEAFKNIPTPAACRKKRN